MPGIYGHLYSALAYGVVMKLQNLLFVRSYVPDRVQPVGRRNARTQKIEVHFLLFGSEAALKSELSNQWLCKQ